MENNRDTDIPLPRRPCLWLESVGRADSDCLNPKSPHMIQYSPTNSPANVEDEVENLPPFQPQKAVPLAKQDNVLLLPAATQSARNRKPSIRCTTSSPNRISKNTKTRNKTPTTPHFKVSKPGAHLLGRTLRDRQCYWANSITLDKMLASATECSKDDLDQTLRDRRRASLPMATRRRSRSLVSCEERPSDELADLRVGSTPEAKTGTQTSYWSSHTPHTFDRALSPSISDCTTLMGDENMDTLTENTTEVQDRNTTEK